MSEQETDLDTAIQLFQLVETFDEYKEGLREVLTRVHTQEELDRARKVIDEKKQYMIENNTEFNAVMEQRERENKMRADESRALHRAQMAEAEAEASMDRSKVSMARSKAMSRVRGAVPDSDLDEFVARTRFKTVEPEELERRLEDKLGCPNPKCEDYGKNRRNIINNIPSCGRCFHRLVPKSEFKDYNRKYWRRYNKRRKKK